MNTLKWYRNHGKHSMRLFVCDNKNLISEKTFLNCRPTLTATLQWELIGFPILVLLAFIVILNILPPYKYKKAKKVKTDEEEPSDTTELLSKNKESKQNDDLILTGQKAIVGEDYIENWTDTFDLVFLIFMLSVFVVLSLATTFYNPSLWSNGTFGYTTISKTIVDDICISMYGFINS